MSALAQKREELLAKQRRFAEIMAEAKDPSGNLNLEAVASLTGTSAEKAAKIRELNDEMTAIGRDCEVLAMEEKVYELQARVDQAIERGPFGNGAGKTLGELYTESPAFKNRIRGGIGAATTLTMDPRTWLAEAGLKTVMQAGGPGWVPQAIRTGVVIPIATRPVQILDLIPQGSTDQASVLFMEETTFTNAAAETAEAAIYPESALALTERTSPVRKIPTFLPVTDEQLDDVPQVQGYINTRLVFMLRQKLDAQVLVGTGVAPQLTGLLNVAGIQTQAKGADTALDATYKALVKVLITGRAFPSGIIYHPTDWQNIKLLKDTTGRYIWGDPSSDIPDRCWGLPVAQCDAFAAAGTAVVADFVNFTVLDFRRNLDVQIGFVNDDFVKGKKSIRADVRVAFVVYRPAAICTVTGL